MYKANKEHLIRDMIIIAGNENYEYLKINFLKEILKIKKPNDIVCYYDAEHLIFNNPLPKFIVIYEIEKISDENIQMLINYIQLGQYIIALTKNANIIDKKILLHSQVIMIEKQMKHENVIKETVKKENEYESSGVESFISLNDF
jgi:hypothetical protein